MVEFPYLIKAVMPLKINFDGARLINDYYARSRFAEHLLMLREFQEIFPQEYVDFKKINYKKIKREIREVFLDDIDFFASDGEDNRIDFLVDMVYPEILECYKLRDSKRFWNDYRMRDSYLWNQPDEQEREEIIKNNEEENRKEEEERKKAEEIIESEKEALLGGREELSDEEIIDFIHRNATNTAEAEKLIEIFNKQSPWYICPFFSNWNRLSLLLAFYREEKKLPFTSASFYEQLTAYLIKEYSEPVAIGDVNSLVEMFSAFAFDMMENGQTIFSKQNIEKHPAFKYKLETGAIDFSTLLSFPFWVQRGKWYEFRTPVFQVYLSLKKFLGLSEKERIDSYVDFLDLSGCFADWEHDIWLLCSELDLQNFNQYYLIPILNEYLLSVDTTNRYTVCSSTLKFFNLIMDFKIPEDIVLPEPSGTSWSGMQISLLSFIDKDFFEIDFYLGCSEEDESDNNNQSDLLRLSRFILKKGFETYEKDEYEFDLAKHCSNPELLEIFESLGVCDFLWNFYHDGLAMVEKAVAANYNIRLDRYPYDPEARIFASEK